MSSLWCWLFPPPLPRIRVTARVGRRKKPQSVPARRQSPCSDTSLVEQHRVDGNGRVQKGSRNFPSRHHSDLSPKRVSKSPDPPSDPHTLLRRALERHEMLEKAQQRLLRSNRDVISGPVDMLFMEASIELEFKSESAVLEFLRITFRRANRLTTRQSVQSNM